MIRSEVGSIDPIKDEEAFLTEVNEVFGYQKSVITTEIVDGKEINRTRKIKVEPRPEEEQIEYLCSNRFTDALIEDPTECMEYYRGVPMHSTSDSDSRNFALTVATAKALDVLTDEDSIRPVLLDVISANVDKLKIPERPSYIQEWSCIEPAELIANRIQLLFGAYEHARTEKEKALFSEYILKNSSAILSYLKANRFHDNADGDRTTSISISLSHSLGLKKFLHDKIETPTTETEQSTALEYFLYLSTSARLYPFIRMDYVDYIQKVRPDFFESTILPYYGLHTLKDYEDLKLVWGKSKVSTRLPLDSRATMKEGLCLGQMISLSEVYPNAVYTLMNECGLHHFDRYSISDLLAQAQLLETDPDKFYGDLEAVFFEPIDDHNGVWNTKLLTSPTSDEYEKMMRSNQLRAILGEDFNPQNKAFFEISSYDQLFNFFKKINEVKMRLGEAEANSMKLIRLGAHSDSSTMYFNGRDKPLTADNLQELSDYEINKMTSSWSPNLIIFLTACSTARAGTRSIASKIADKFQSIVYGFEHNASKELLVENSDELIGPDDTQNDSNVLILPNYTYNRVSSISSKVSQSKLPAKVKDLFLKMYPVMARDKARIFYGKGVI